MEEVVYGWSLNGFVTGASDLLTHSQQKTARGQTFVLSGAHRAPAPRQIILVNIK